MRVRNLRNGKRFKRRKGKQPHLPLKQVVTPTGKRLRDRQMVRSATKAIRRTRQRWPLKGRQRAASREAAQPSSAVRSLGLVWRSAGTPSARDITFTKREKWRPART